MGEILSQIKDKKIKIKKFRKKVIMNLKKKDFCVAK